MADDKVKIRTTFMPDREIEVSPEEALDLKRMGRVYEGNATTDEGARRAVERQQAPAATRTPRPPRKKTTAKAAAPAADAAAGTPATTTSQEG